MNHVNRRQFNTGLAGAAAAALLPTAPAIAADPPPEITSVRVPWSPAICFAPIYVIEEFLRAEGFEEIEYVRSTPGTGDVTMMSEGRIDLGITFAGVITRYLDQGWPVTALGGVHVGCYEFFAHEPVQSVRDLKGRKVGINNFSSGDHVYISIMAKNVGLDPHNDIVWVTNEDGRAVEAFVAGETDAYLAFPPTPQRLRSRGVDRIILNTTLDQPWSQYFCCMLYGNSEWVRRHPVATKRFLRALYKAAELCTQDPTASARRLVEGGFEKNYDHALETIRSIPYDLWHDYDSEDTLRFYALTLHEAGMLKNPPNKLLAEGTNWRFLNELRREMKG